MRNLLLTIKYKGTRYHGWQIQKNALTVQEIFQKALTKILTEQVNIKACSRTDTGVHANRFCISFKTNSKIKEHKLVLALNNNLPFDIAVLSCVAVNDDFHARYNTCAKRYIYKIHNSKIKDPFLENLALFYPYKLDEKLLNKAAKKFIGTYNFKGFCSIKNDIKDTVRTIYSCNVTKTDEIVTVSITADGFLYNMVRIIIGTLLFVAMGKILSEDIEAIIKSGIRKKAGFTAPAEGLYLDKVFYNDDFLMS